MTAWYWLVHVAGVDYGLPFGRWSWYNFFSGVGSDIGEVSIIGGMIALYRKHACHEPRCWRLGHHPVAGTPYAACRKHHPGLPDKPRKGEIARAWHAARKQRVTKSTGGPDAGARLRARPVPG